MSFSAEKALKHRVVLLAGAEELLRRRALEALLATSGAQDDDFDLQYLDADMSNPVDWAAAAGTSPFLALRRVVVVRHLLRADAATAKGAGLATLPESALLILVADEEAASDERVQRARTAARKVWEKEVSTAGGHVAVFEPDPKKASEAVRAEAARLGKEMSPMALEALVEMTGGSLSRAVDELEKVVLFAGSQERILESDVYAVVVPSREWNVFKMVEATTSGQIPQALHHLKTLVVSAQKADSAAHAQILPLVSRQLKLLWQARLCIEHSCRPEDPSETVSRMLPDKPNISKEAPYRQSRLVQAARRATLPKLARCLQIVSDTDARLKGLLTQFSAVDSLERMVLEMAEEV